MTSPRSKRDSAAAERAVVEGACHCGFVTFVVHSAPSAVLVCNCTICTMKGYLHWIVERSDFRLLTPASWSDLPVYRFGTRTAMHLFCPVCGVAAFYVPRSDPDKVDVNLRCLRGVALDALPVETFDGQDWDAAYERYRSK